MTQQRWRSIFVLALTLIAAYTVAPTVIYFSQPVEVRQDTEELEKKIETEANKA